MNQNKQNAVLKILQQVLTLKKRLSSSVEVADVLPFPFSIVQWGVVLLDWSQVLLLSGLIVPIQLCPHLK